ncbi:4Fe-4S ferredoxin, partial [Achromatium sp. WMS2]
MHTDSSNITRRALVKGLGTAVVAAGTLKIATAAWHGHTLAEAFAEFFQSHYQRMTPEELQDVIHRIERGAKQRYGVNITCEHSKAETGVVFGYALNISKCKGYRDCVHACVAENNLGSDTQYIRVLEMPHGSAHLEDGNHYFSGTVPKPKHYYLPIQCMHCENPPCV